MSKQIRLNDEAEVVYDQLKSEISTSLEPKGAKVTDSLLVITLVNNYRKMWHPKEEKEEEVLSV